MSRGYAPVDLDDESGISAAEMAWQRATVFEFNGTRIETPFAKMNRSSVKWYLLGSLIIWSCIFYGCYRAYTTTISPFIWEPSEDNPPIKIDPSLLEEQKGTQIGPKNLDNPSQMQQVESVVRRPVRKKSDGGLLEKLMPKNL